MSLQRKKQLVLVLGMHRSGTSLAAGLLCKCGIDFGENLMPPTEDNPKGYFEDMDFVEINDRILKKFKSIWHDHETIPINLWKTLRYRKYIKEISQTLEEKFRSRSVLGIKDPRIARLLPLWEKFSGRYAKRYIIVFRSPFEVAESLRTRDQFPIEKGLRLWLAYNRDILKYTAGKERLVFSYESLINEPHQFVTTVCEALQVPSKVGDNLEFVDKGLYRSRSDFTFEDIADSDLRNACHSVYQELQSFETQTGH